jgi:hypothetical protein
MPRPLNFDRWAVSILGHGTVPAARMVVDFYVTRSDLIQGAILAIDHRLNEWDPSEDAIRLAGQAVSATQVNISLREALKSYGTIFLEFGASGKTTTSDRHFPEMYAAAKVAVDRLWPDLAELED